MAAARRRAATLASPVLQEAVATGEWWPAREWALDRARESMRPVLTGVASDWRLQLAQACLEQAMGEPHAHATAAAYSLVVDAQQQHSDDELEHLRHIAKRVRDALIVDCVFRAGGHGDMGKFDMACLIAFGWDPKLDQRLYAQLHHSYQQLFAHVEDRFRSNSEREGRRRKRRDREGQPRQAPEEPEREVEEPEREDEPGKALAAPGTELDESATAELDGAGGAWHGAGLAREAAATAEPQTPRPSARGSAGGASPAALGAGLPGDDGAAAPPQAPAGFPVPEGLRRRLEMEAVLDHLVRRDVPAAVCNFCVVGLGKRLRDMQDDLWSQGAPGQELCSQMLRELSVLIQRFPEEPGLHGTCIDLLTWMCVVRGDLLGLQAPGTSQEHPQAGAIARLDRATQCSVKEAVDIAEKADPSGLIFAHEERTRLLVRTQPLSDLLRTVDLDETMALLDEVKHGLSWYIDAMREPEHKDFEYAKAFLQTVRNHHQQEYTSTELTERWVQRAEMSGNHKNYDERYKTEERFTVVGLLFGVSAHILGPLPERQDTRMIKTSLNAVYVLNIIQPFDWDTQAEIVGTIQKLGGKQQREVFGSSLSEYWMGCEAAYVGLLGTLLQGSYCRSGASQHTFDPDTVDWVIQEACDIVGHATDGTSGPVTGSDNTWVLYPALWCLSKVFEGTRPRDAWQEAVDVAAKRALQYSLNFNSKSAQESEEEACKLRRLCRGGSCE